MSLIAQLELLRVPKDQPFEELPMPMSLVDRSGLIRWQNRASREIMGAHLSEHFLTRIAEGDRLLARERFTGFLYGSDGRQATELVVLDAEGGRLRIRARSQPVRDRDGAIVAVLTAFIRTDAETPVPELTARQRQVLELLAEGRSTPEVATELGIAIETARNHIRGLFASLGVHSRIEAVARGRELGLV